MKDELMRHADAAQRHLVHLEAWDPRSYADLADTVDEMRSAIAGADEEPVGRARGHIAVLAGYIQSTAYYLHEHLIPLCEQQASEAAREVGHAATRLLIVFGYDYGEIMLN